MRRRVSWVAVALLGAVTFACSGDDGGDDEVRRPPDEDTAVVDLLTSSHQAIGALGTERSVTGLDILGGGDVVATAVEDPTEARRQTDSAVATLVAAVEDHEDEGAAYGPALDALAGLGSVRGEVDARTEPRSLEQVPAAEAVAARYDEVATALHEANAALADAVEEPGLRRGATLYATAVEQSDLWPRLTTTLMMSVLTGSGSLDEAEDVAEIAEMWGEAETARSFVVELAAGSEYEGPARTLDADLGRSTYVDAVETALRTGDVDLSALTDGAQASADQGWPAFLQQVEESLAG